jgi:lipopolysaccharide export system protein LptA
MAGKAVLLLKALALAACLASTGAVALIVLAPTALAQTQQSAISGLKLSGDQPIQIESDQLQVREADNVAVFTGNVSVVQGQTQLKAGKMTVYYIKGEGSATTGSAGIDHLEVDDKVYVKSNTQVATGDRGTFDMKSEVLVLSGKEVVLTDGPNVLVGCKLTVHMKTGKAQVDGCKKNGGSGRVQMSITPGSQSQ